MNAHGYPVSRWRAQEFAPAIGERFGRIESSYPEVNAGDTDTDVFIFSGIPDLIRLHARSNGALFTLTDRLGRETHEVLVRPNDTQDVRLGRQVVVARNLVGGSVAIVFVEGYYAAPAERIEADRDAARPVQPTEPELSTSPGSLSSVSADDAAPPPGASRFRWR